MYNRHDTAIEKKGPDPYLQQKIQTASPEQLISYLLDMAISACHREDKYKASRIVSELIISLDPQYLEVVTPFYHVYQHVNYLIRNQQFEAARALLLDLQETWNTAFKVS